MKATTALPWLISILAIITILLLRNDPAIYKELANLTEPPQRDYDIESFTFGDDNGVEDSNKQTCVIIYDYATNSYNSGTIVQSNLVNSAPEIIQILGKYGWRASGTNGNIFFITRPIGQTNGYFFVGDPSANKVLIP
ncbi:MAG TPA: hypothetical protein VGI03_14550 [Verrucomicrobiae bacterium]|jgi:hypothetical protein